mmetsp:Transcript_3552/g.5651  ORF Transcript_3552/g.5651 Transcript_3552/m.5651 type:complete len:447 (-) Transcript_3552:488-1828(-)
MLRLTRLLVPCLLATLALSSLPSSLQGDVATASIPPATPPLRGRNTRVPTREVSQVDIREAQRSGFTESSGGNAQEGSGGQSVGLELRDGSSRDPKSDKIIDQAEDFSTQDWLNEVGEIGEILGVGSFSTVHAATNITNGQPLAIKMVKVPEDNDIFIVRLRREVNILMEMDHANIIRLLKVYEVPGKVNLVMERCQGGELFSLLEGMEFDEDGTRNIIPLGQSESEIFKFDEALVVEIVHQVLSVVEHMHSRKIVHRDLKLENVLFNEPYLSPNKRHEVKVVDFGFAKVLDEGEELYSACGSPHYAAPEVVAAKDSGVGYRFACDMWAVGVITYTLLCCQYPFDGETDGEVIQKVQTGDFTFPDHVTVSAEAEDFVRKLIVKDVGLRATAFEALQHPWIKRHEGIRDYLHELEVKGSTPKPRGGSDPIILKHMTSPVSSSLGLEG